MDIITGDFETYFSTDYSLKKMGTIDYVRDARFHAHGCAIKENFGDTFWVSHDELPSYFAQVDWANTFWISHNTYFDGLILTQQYDIPRNQVTWSDTLSMARAIFPHGMSLDLDNACRVLGLGGKIAGLAETKGLMDLPEKLEQKLAAYAINDVDKCFSLFLALWRALPWDEHDLLHMTLRMGVEPVLNIDEPLARRAYDEAITHQADMIKATGYSKTRLGSNPQFAEILRGLGIEPPTKISLANGKETFAFAKGDLAFKNLMADYPEHRALWEGRLASKSNIEMSRAERFINIHEAGDGTLPMPLKFWGAHTGRWSGADSINVQNLPRAVFGDPDSAKLRRSILAPEGYYIIVVDSSQIELRVNAWFAGQEDVLNVLRTGQCVYCHAATAHFGYEVIKGVHKDERQFGKMLELALGFGMGAPKFRTQAALGFMGVPPTIMTLDEAYDAVNLYRSTHQAIVNNWKFLNERIPMMVDPDYSEDYKCVQFNKGNVLLPNDMMLDYPNLQVDEENQWTYGIGKKIKKIYGGLFDENIVQALARVFLGEKMLEIERHTAVQLVSSTHDEPIGIVRIEDAEQAEKELLDIMKIPPAWAPDLPVDAEGGYAVEYSK